MSRFALGGDVAFGPSDSLEVPEVKLDELKGVLVDPALYREVTQYTMHTCIDDRFPGGIIGGTLAHCLSHNFSVLASEDWRTTRLTSDLQVVGAIMGKSWLHDGCYAFEHLFAVLARLVPFSTLYELYERIAGEPIDERTQQATADWVRVLPSSYMDVGSVDEYKERLGINIEPSLGDHRTNVLLVNLTSGKFYGHRATESVVGARPVVIDAELSRYFARQADPLGPQRKTIVRMELLLSLAFATLDFFGPETEVLVMHEEGLGLI